MAAATVTTEQPLLKYLYPQKTIHELIAPRSTFAALLERKTDLGGNGLVLALRYANKAGVSADFGEAQANKGPTRSTAFTILNTKLYSLFSVDNELIHRAQGDKSQIVNVIETEVDGAFEALRIAFDSNIWGNGGGAIGALSTTTTVSSTTITLNDPDSAINFEEGDWIQLSATDGTSGAVRTGKLQIVAMDPDAGTLTTSAAINTILGASASSNTTFGDYIFRAGMFGRAIKGVSAWVPATAPGATPFFGVDRSINPSKLGGVRIAGTATLPIEEAILKALQIMYRRKAKTSHVFINDSQFLKLVLALGARRMYTDLETPFGQTYKALQVIGPLGPVSILPDPYLDAATGYAMQMDTWSLRSAGEFPMFLNKDGSKMIDEPSADAMEGRIGGYPQLANDAPGFNGRFTLSTT